MDALIQEQERLIVEEHLEEVQHQKQEQEERMMEVTQPAEDEQKDVSCAEDPVTVEVTDQEKEEKPCDVTTDDDTRVSTFKDYNRLGTSPRRRFLFLDRRGERRGRGAPRSD